MTATVDVEQAALRRRIDSYLVRRGRPQTTSMLSYIFAGHAPDRRAVLDALDELERAGKITHSRAGWEATQAP